MAKRDYFCPQGKRRVEGKRSGEKEMSVLCPECGAVLSEGSTCQTIFEELLSLEYTNSAYGQVHFFTVACFMIQHRRYSDEALAGMQSLLRAYLDEELTAQQLRERARRGMNTATRTWKVRRQTDAPPQPKVAWRLSIADVAQSIQDPQKYGEHVKQWARATLQQMPALLQ